jgi:predicted ATP-dependent endonuclease of OLD family
MPIYRYIDWNLSLSILSDIVMDAVSQRIQDPKQQLDLQALELSKQVNDMINKDLASDFSGLIDDLPHVNGIKVGMSFTVKESIADIVLDKDTSDGDVNLESQGEGLKKQICFTILKWMSLQEIIGEDIRKKFIWCFDEPEVHLFPTAQRELFDIIKNLASKNFQIFTCTHSTLFIDRIGIKHVNKVLLNTKGYSEILKCSSVSDIHSTLGVKNSDILFYDKFLAVEGFTDFYLIPYLYELQFEKSLDEEAIQFINLKGASNWKANMHILKQVLKDFNKPDDCVFYILDNDISSEQNNIAHLGKCDIEDSISNDIWIKVVLEHCNVKLVDDDLNKIRESINLIKGDMKFHKLLSDLVKVRKTKDDKYLPAKGAELADLLKKYILTKDQIPKDVIAAFTKFNFK